MTENKYQLGKIYKLTSEHTDKIYVGSTCKKLLSTRLSIHKNHYKRWKDGKCGYISSIVLFELGLVQISLLEDYSCNTKDELLARERYWIEQHRVILVNKNIPSRTDEEYKEYIIQYNQDNKYKINEYKKANKEKKKEYNKQYYAAKKREENKNV